MSESGAATARNRVRALVGAGVALATFAAFAPALGAGFLSFDDRASVVENPYLRGLTRENLGWMLTTFWLGHWHPLTWFSLALDREVWGVNAFGFHLTNAVLHVWNALAVYLLFDALLARNAATTGAGRALASAAGALFFAVHPLRVESVAWVTERRDVLCGAFLIPAVLVWVRATELDGRARRRRIQGSLALFALSLLCKAWGVTLPVVLLALDVWLLGRWQQGRAIRRGLLIEKIPYAILALGAAALAPRAQAEFGAMPTLAEHTAAERALQAGYALAFYCWKSLAPFHLHPAYLLPEEVGIGEARFALGCLVSVSLTAVFWALRSRWPPGWCAWLVFVVVAAPTLGFTQSGLQLAADRYTYFACLPWAAVAAAGWARWCQDSAARAIAATLILLSLGTATWRQAGLWRDAETLWTHALRSEPQNYLALSCRGNARLERGDLAGSLADFNAAIAAHPDWAGAYAHRATVRRRSGDAAGALADYDRSLAIDASDVRVRNRRAELRAGQRDYAGAIEDYSFVLELDPENYEAWGGRGSARFLLGASEEAAGDLERGLELAPAAWPFRAALERTLARARARD